MLNVYISKQFLYFVDYYQEAFENYEIAKEQLHIARELKRRENHNYYN